jgi:hypothetical protein
VLTPFAKLTTSILVLTFLSPYSPAFSSALLVEGQKSRRVEAFCSSALLPFCPPALLPSCLLFYYEAENKVKIKVKIKVRGLKYLYYKYKLRLIIKKIYKIYKINIKININLRLI